MKRLADHIIGCIESDKISVHSECDNWNGGVYTALCSKDIYERNVRSWSNPGDNDNYGYNCILNTNLIKDGDWVLNRPYREGWVWNRQWNFYLRKWKNGSFIQVTGLTQAEKNMIGDAWRHYSIEQLIEKEKQKIKNAILAYNDSTGEWP